MKQTEHLLFELGCEELPPKSLKKLSLSLLENILADLAEAGLGHGQASSYATPRRLAVLVRDLELQQPDKIVEKRGPALQAAYQADGSPSKAALGFAASCGVAFEQLEKLVTDKGEWLIYQQAVAGQAAAALIPDILRKSLRQLPIAKRMRWGAGDNEFARPVHWVVLLLGSDVIPAEILGINSGEYSRGHRFHAPRPIRIAQADAYADTLLQEGKIIADFGQRLETIRAAAQQAAAALGGITHIEEELLEEVAALNEWPTPIVGNFNPRFLELPKEVLITTMQANQKYFPVTDNQNALLPHFITFSNIESKNPAAIQHGNERVVLPRLTDAEFFWKQDRKHSLADRVDPLADIIFQKDLGSLLDKTGRVRTLAVALAAQLSADAALADRAALLAKTDLLTQMVGEFANLQGVMGRYYALADGEDPQVALALEQHYWPKQAGGPTPEQTTGQIVALAEKIDSLAGIFSAGLTPTGDKDPYALRRAALGILRILIENRLPLDVTALLDAALTQFTHAFNLEETRARLVDFIFDRLKGYCLEQGYAADAFEAVMTVRPSRPLDFMQRLQAVQNFRQRPEAESLAAANKRIGNILKKSAAPADGGLDALREPAELALLTAAQATQQAIAPLLAAQDYAAALNRLAQLREPVDLFFDQVMVNVEDEALRNSRLALLQFIAALFLDIADIGKLQA